MSRLTTSIFAMTTAALLSVALAGCQSQSPAKPSRPAVPDNFSSLMPPQSLLRDDTIEAASHDRSSSRLAYVGVWAKSGDACAMMDQTAFDGFAVITPNSLRRPGETCSFDQGAAGQGYQQFDASCKVRRKKRKRTIIISMMNSTAMSLSVDGKSQTLTRCHMLK
ncbi:hypothetical protein [Hoeflea sp.]|uniref:hypothetical protein n=1 Tax=Hoeflea sp. TaxID=1940281 RepID=UPI003747F25B